MIKNIIFICLVAATTLVLAVAATPILRNLLLSAGVLKEEILIAGTGSMYPTFPKGEGSTDIIRAKETVAWPKMRRLPSGISIFGYKLFSYDITEGDIVEFENEKTRLLTQQKYEEEAGFVKRVIATAGDKIELNDGFVFLNGKILNEPYIAKSRSTYGGNFLPDCKVLTIPPGQIFVLGDNRKASLDSRFDLQLVKLVEVKFVLPWSNQEEYKKNWRDTSGDTTLAHTTTLDPVEFVKLVNERREKRNLKPLIYNSLLSLSSKRRGYAMIAANDFSSEATKSGVTLSTALKEVGYQNIVFAEVFARGFYGAEELLDNFLEFPDTAKILFSDQYQDIGLSPALGKIDNCPTQVVVAHLGGYVPPNYSKDEWQSWEKLVDNIDKVLPSWQLLKTAERIDQNKLDRLIEVLSIRREHARRIVTRMKSNQWLSRDERQFADDDSKLSREAEQIINDLSKGR